MAEVEMAVEAADMAVEDSAAAAAPATTAAAAIKTTDEVVTTVTTDEIVHESEQPQTRLTGGSIDDNERFADYLAYRADFFGLGIPVRDLDPAGRIVVTVTGEGGLPAAGAEVVVAADQMEVSLRTTADGTVRFHPEAYAAGDGPFTVSAGNATTMADRGENVTLETSYPPRQARPSLSTSCSCSTPPARWTTRSTNSRSPSTRWPSVSTGSPAMWTYAWA